MISHDRHFLNSVCTHIADIDYQTVIMYTGGYDDMVLAKTQIRSRIEAENAVREKKIAQLNEFIARFSAGTRSSQVMSRKKEVERLQTSELARSNIARPYIRFQMKQPFGAAPLEIKGLAKSYGDLKVISAFHGQRERGEKIALIGPQRLGQDHPAEIADPQRHRIHRRCRPAFPDRWRHGQVGARSGRRILRAGPHRFHHQRHDRHRVAAPVRSQGHAGGIARLLGQMLFSGEDALKPTGALSGGESARLIFCRLMLQKPNVLVLDEPTNHLDLESINALNIALQKYEGTVLLVTHDHDVIDEVATRIWHFKGGQSKTSRARTRNIWSTRKRKLRKSEHGLQPASFVSGLRCGCSGVHFSCALRTCGSPGTGWRPDGNAADRQKSKERRG